MKNLEELREKLDSIDEKLVELIKSRADLALEVREVKKAKSDDVYSPAREQEILERAMDQVEKSPISRNAIEQIMRLVLSTNRSIVGDMRVAYFGPEHSASYQAAHQHFGPHISASSCLGIEDVFEQIEQGNSSYGVIPVETSAQGLVTESFDMLMQSKLVVIGEVLTQRNYTLAASGVGLDAITQVYGELEAFAECRKWLSSNLGRAEQIIVSNPVDATKKAQQEIHAAALCTSEIANAQGLKVLANTASNTLGASSRLFVLGEKTPPSSGKDKTSILCSVKERSGALLDVLEPFAKENITLSKIESKAMRTRAWDYVFFIDLLGHQDDSKVADAIKSLENKASYLKVLGSYPSSLD